jgi:Single-stranded DNA-specific exonuclease
MGVLDKVSHTLIKYGGHSQAAGIALQPEKVQEFADCFERAVRESLGPNGVPEIIVDYDEYLHLGEVRSSDLVELTKLEPFGEGNPFPVFLIDPEIVESRTVGKEDEHIKMIAKTKDGYAEIIAYGLAKKIEPIIGKIKAMVRFKSSAWSDLGFEFELIEIL